MGNRVLTYMLLNSGLILTIVMLIFALTQRALQGEWHWVGSNVSLTLALALFLLQPLQSSGLGLIAANLLYTMSIVLLDSGLRTFRSRPLPMVAYTVVLVGELLLLALFTFAIPNHGARVVTVSLWSAGLYTAVSLNALRRFPEMPQTMPIFLGSVFLLTATFFAFRALNLLLLQGHDLLGGRAPRAATYVVYTLGIGAWIGGMVGFIILKNQHLHDRVERYAERLRALHEVYRRILELEPVGATAAFALARLDGLIETRGSEVLIVDPEKREMTLLATTLGALDSDRGETADAERIPEWWDEVAQGLAGGKELFLEQGNAPGVADKLIRARKQGRIESLLVAAIRVNGELAGILWTGAADRSHFTEERCQAAAEFASAVSLAVHNARARESLAVHAGRLERSLAEKEVLLNEVHHRVKNNLQVISSLLYLQSTGKKNQELNPVLKEMQDRVRSIVFVHEKLYGSATIGELRFGDYVRSLIGHLLLSNGIDSDRIDCSVMDSDLLLPADFAVPLGLIINEVISNSLKHAFPENRKGTISIELKGTDDGCFLITLRDDGVGLPVQSEPPSGMGLRIVEALCRQIGATLSVDSTKGTAYSIRIPHPVSKE